MLQRDGGIALIRGCSEKRIWGTWQSYYGIFNGGTNSRERKGSEWTGGKQAWENKEKKGIKGPVKCKLVWLGCVPDHHSLPYTLIKFYFCCLGVLCAGWVHLCAGELPARLAGKEGESSEWDCKSLGSCATPQQLRTSADLVPATGCTANVTPATRVVHILCKYTHIQIYSTAHPLGADAQICYCQAPRTWTCSSLKSIELPDSATSNGLKFSGLLKEPPCAVDPSLSSHLTTLCC